MTNEDVPKTIWGEFPVFQDETEVAEVWNQIARRVNRTAELEGRIPRPSELGDRVREYLGLCSPLGNWASIRAAELAEKLDDQKAGFGYALGAADMLEMLGTLAMNREAEAIGKATPPEGDQSTS
jgi:hypothetical protein